MAVDMRSAVEAFGPILSENDDVTITPDIPRRKLRKAIRAYGRPLATPDDVLLLVDNTLLRSAKDGLMLTSTHLLGRSGPGGVVILPYTQIESVIPDASSLGGFPLPGISINELEFIALPGLMRNLDSVEQPAVLALVALLYKGLGIDIPGSEGDGDELSDFIKSDFIKSDFNKSDFNKED